MADTVTSLSIRRLTKIRWGSRKPSYEEGTMDAEVVSLADSLLGGIKVGDDPITLETIGRVGPSGSFVEDEHTVPKHALTLSPFHGEAPDSWIGRGEEKSAWLLRTRRSSRPRRARWRRSNQRISGPRGWIYPPCLVDTKSGRHDVRGIMFTSGRRRKGGRHG